MQRVDASFLYTTGGQIHPLSELARATKLNTCIWSLVIAERALEQLLISVFRLKTSRESAETLLNLVKGLSKRAMDSSDNEEEVGWTAHTIVDRLRDFEAVMSAEFRVSAVYLATQKKGLDPGTMIDSGWEAFPNDMPTKVPAAVPDARDAMRAIMFELPTAAGFHLHRANESVLRCYWDAVTNGAPRPQDRNMGTYLRELDKLGVGDPVVKSALRDLKDQHRNPLIHPEHSLDSVDDAYALYCGIFNAMLWMLKAIPVPAPLPPVPGLPSSPP